MQAKRPSADVQSLRALFENQGSSDKNRDRTPSITLPISHIDPNRTKIWSKSSSNESAMTDMDSRRVPSNGFNGMNGGTPRNAALNGRRGTPQTNEKDQTPRSLRERASGTLRDRSLFGDSASSTPSKPAQEPVSLPIRDAPHANPDKLISADEEEPGQLKPADPKTAATAEQTPSAQTLNVNSQDARNSRSPNITPSRITPARQPEAEVGRPSPEAVGNVPSPSNREASKPSPIATDLAPHPAPSSAKSPLSAGRSSLSGTHDPESPRDALRKPGRSSLTAPTAASMARAKPSGPPAADTKPKPSTSKTRSGVRVPSTLTAPTASSQAKRESIIQPSGGSRQSLQGNAAQSSKPRFSSMPMRSPHAHTKPPSGALPSSNSRSNLGRASGESFLDRLTRPTASTARKAHEKLEVGSSPRRQASVSNNRTNGVKPRNLRGAGRDHMPAGTNDGTHFGDEEAF